MQIGTDASQITSLMSLWGTSGDSLYGNLLGGGSSETSSTFGPATILSLGSSSSSSSSGYLSLDLASILSLQQGTTTTASTLSQQLTDQEKESLNEAFDLIEAGSLDEAETVLDGILSKKKTNAVATHALGLVALERGEYKKAEQYFRRADQLLPDVGYADDAEDAQILAQDDAAVFKVAAKLAPNPSTRDQAIGLLLRLTARAPDNLEAQVLLGETMLDKGDFLNGLDVLAQAIDAATNTSDDEASGATSGRSDAATSGATNDGLLQRIEAKASELVQRMPNAPQFHRLLGRVQVRLGKYEEALQTLDRAAELADSDELTRTDAALAYAGIGRELLARGDIDRAMANLQSAKDLDAGHFTVREAVAEGHLALAERRRRYGDLKRAIQSYDDASRELGAAGSESLRNRIASAAYAAGVRMEQQSIQQGRAIDTEVLAFEAAYRLDTENKVYKRKLADTRSTIGDQYLADGEYEQAVGAYERAYKLYKNDDTYKSNLTNAYILYGDDLLSRGKYDKAVATYLEAYRVDTSDANSKAKLANGYNVRGLDYRTKGRFTLAVADFKEALHLFPDSAEYQANYDSVAAYDN